METAMAKAISFSKEEEILVRLIQSNQIPTYRQAYSDRTAWLMACLSEMVYQPFGNLDTEATIALLNKKLDEFLHDGRTETLNQLITAATSSEAEQNKLFAELENYNISVEQTYDKDGTQAFLISTERYIALVFRGTEANSLQDIKADITAIKTHCTTSGSVHLGFNNAFILVEEDIQHELNKEQYAKKPLIIAGHSLGGL